MVKNLRQQPLQRPAQPRLTSQGERKRRSEQTADQNDDVHAESPRGEGTVNATSNEKQPRVYRRIGRTWGCLMRNRGLHALGGLLTE